MSGWRRDDHLHRAGDGEFDTVVVGGGIVGAGVALDLAARGARVLLLERTDYGAETSSRSSKLIHGGIRYLPQLRFGMVKEGLEEQRRLAANADYLYWPLEFILPYYRRRGFADMPGWLRQPRLVPAALKFGLWLYDTLGGRRRHRSRRLSREQVLRRIPGLDPEGLRGGFVYWDAQTDDSRLTLAILKTAVDDYGVLALNWAEVTDVERDETAGHRVIATDRLSGKTLEFTSPTVVLATGPFPIPIRSGEREWSPIVMAKGIHLVVPPELLGVTDAALVLPETEDGRVLYVIPWEGKTWIGTTDTRYEANPAHPVATDEDIAYMVRHLDEYLSTETGEPLTAIAGVRALASAGANTAKASRSPRVEELHTGLVRVAGGKLTGYRPLAATVADLVADRLGLAALSSTADLELTGNGADRTSVTEAATGAGLADSYADRLYRRYGSNAFAVLERIADHPGFFAENELTRGEVRYQAATEGAAAVSDVLLRRTHVAWLTPDHGRKAAATVAQELASELGWDETATRKSLAEFEAALEAENL